jgi:hypothetical protein
MYRRQVNPIFLMPVSRTDVAVPHPVFSALLLRPSVKMPTSSLPASESAGADHFRPSPATLLLNERGAKLRDVQARSAREAVSLLTVRSTPTRERVSRAIAHLTARSSA